MKFLVLVALAASAAAGAAEPKPTDNLHALCRELNGPATLMSAETGAVQKLGQQAWNDYQQGRLVRLMAAARLDGKDQPAVEAVCHYYLQGVEDAIDTITSFNKQTK